MPPRLPLHPGQRLIRYGLVGTIGFAVDATILTLLLATVQPGIVAARSVSFAAAVSVTWILNRSVVFPARRGAAPAHEYMRHVAVQAVGAAINLLVFFALVQWHEGWSRFPVAPLAAGAACSMVFTYLASTRFVFVGTARLDVHTKP